MLGCWVELGMRKGTVAMVMGKCMCRSSPDLLISMLTCGGGSRRNTMLRAADGKGMIVSPYHHTHTME